VRAPTFLHRRIEDAPGGPMLVNRRTGRWLATTIETAFDSAARRRGLLGRDMLPDGAGLIIAPCNGIHTFFMRFAIDVVFVARHGRVVSVRRGLNPWRLALAPRAFATIELPVGAIEASGTRAGDDLEIVETLYAD
jgi:uncharacterized membrane protein (UPF0127 family)